MARQRAFFSALSLLCPALLPAGCVQSSNDPDVTSYVLLDRAARDRWTVASDGWQGAPVLPVALDVGEPARLRGAEGARRLDLRGGMLAHVRGARGEVRWLALGEEARDDRLRLQASNAAAAALAELVGGEVAAGPDGLWTLSAPDLLERAAFLEPPEGVIEVLPDAPSGLDERAALEVPSSVELVDMPAPLGGGDPGATGPGSAEAALVGLYAGRLRTLLLDASGGFTVEDRCTGEVIAAGTYAAEDGGVVLRSPGAAPIALGRDRDRLIHPGWDDFAPLAPEPPRRGASGSALGAVRALMEDGRESAGEE